MKIKALVLPFLVLFFIFPEQVSAQDTTALSTDSEVFFQQVSTILLNTPSKKYQEESQVILDRFHARWSVGRFNKDEKDAIRSVIEKMRSLKMRTYPFLYDYIYSLTLLSESKQVPKSVIAWNKFADDILVNRNQRDFQEFMDFTAEIFEKELIHKQGTMSWYQRKAHFKFMLDTVFLVNYEKLNMVCATSKDSSIIIDTKGTFFYDRKLFIGDGGTVKWSRFGKDVEDQIYVKLQHYIIPTENSYYSADSAVLYYKRFFSEPILGKFDEKVFPMRNPHIPGSNLIVMILSFRKSIQISRLKAVSN